MFSYLGLCFIIDSFVLQSAEMASFSGKRLFPVCPPPARFEPSPCPTDSVRLYAAKLLSTFAVQASPLNLSGRRLALRCEVDPLQVLIASVPMASSPVLFASSMAPFL